MYHMVLLLSSGPDRQRKEPITDIIFSKGIHVAQVLQSAEGMTKDLFTNDYLLYVHSNSASHN